MPWQWVINAKGEVSPRATAGWDHFQRHLLKEEGVEFSLGGRIDLKLYRWEPDSSPARR